MGAKDLHAKLKVAGWTEKIGRARRAISRLEKELLAGTITFSLQDVHRVKAELLRQRSELAKAEKWCAHWTEKLAVNS